MSSVGRIGNNIILLRKLKRISQKDLATKSGVSISYLNLIEHGKTNPTIYTLEHVAFALNEPLSNLIIENHKIIEPIQVCKVLRIWNGMYYPICPNCNTSLDREYQNYCDRCGQYLAWDSYKDAIIVNTL